MSIVTRALVGVPAGHLHVHGSQLYHSAGDKYLRAVAEVAHSLPVVLPAVAYAGWISTRCSIGSTVYHWLTGALSNVHPSRYGAPASAAHEPYDVVRDDFTP